MDRAEYLRKLMNERGFTPKPMPNDTPEWQRTLLREFEEEMREHGEPEMLRRRFYGYLQTALITISNTPMVIQKVSTE